MKARHKVREPGARPEIIVSGSVFRQMVQTVGSLPAETGGMLGGPEGPELQVTRFRFDVSASTSLATYSPDVDILNKVLEDWNPSVRLKGFVHSHPGLTRPSSGDRYYATEILSAIEDLEYLLLPIVTTTSDTGFFTLFPWVAIKKRTGIEIRAARITIQAEARSVRNALPVSGCESVDTIRLSSAEVRALVGGVSRWWTARTPHVKQSVTRSPVKDPAFKRVESAYDLELMRESRIIAVGVGTASKMVKDLARAGLRQLCLVDPDTVGLENIATQEYTRGDIGRAKVEALKDQLLDINPEAKVVAVDDVLESIGDRDIRNLAFSDACGTRPRRTIIAGNTDSFFAQAKVNRLALDLGIPSLCSQLYREGRGAEITFTYPGITPACHRCILSSRYKAYLEDGFVNTVSSEGTPISAIEQVNALRVFVALALFHAETNHPRWGRIIERIGARNLIQLRMDPDIETTLGLDIFDRVFGRKDVARLFANDVVWLPQEPECPETGYPYCPDCGGIGDLRRAATRPEKAGLHTDR